MNFPAIYSAGKKVCLPSTLSLSSFTRVALMTFVSASRYINTWRGNCKHGYQDSGYTVEVLPRHGRIPACVMDRAGWSDVRGISDFFFSNVWMCFLYSLRASEERRLFVGVHPGILKCYLVALKSDGRVCCVWLDLERDTGYSGNEGVPGEEPCRFAVSFLENSAA